MGAFPITYNPDGTIQESPYFKDTKLEQVGTFDPYKNRVEAETMAWGFGLKTIKTATGQIYVTNVNTDEYILIKGVDFGTQKITKFIANCAAIIGGTIELHIDAANGKKIGAVSVKSTGSETTFKDFSGAISNPKGVHDLYIVFKGVKDKNLMNFDYWKIQ